MQAEQIKSCSRCFKPILCKKEDINNCFCKEITISDKTRNFLSKTKFDCLCGACLEHYNNLMKEVQKQSTSKKQLSENIHYYKENGYMVFTELYHANKGFCCKNGCRHCPYGYEK